MGKVDIEFCPVNKNPAERRVSGRRDRAISEIRMIKLKALVRDLSKFGRKEFKTSAYLKYDLNPRLRRYEL